jgi:anaerobic magnesium-protoporphyrin IX monomethyl ester cyclase
MSKNNGKSLTNGARLVGNHAPYRRILLLNPTMDAIGAEFMMEDTPLRLEYLAAFVRPHVEHLEIVDLIKEHKPLSYFLTKHRPDLVGVTLNYISTHRSSLELAKEAKRYGADVVFGGYLATALAAEFAAEPTVDYVVRGEGEITLLELVQRHPLKEILGLTWSRGGVMHHNEDRPLVEDLDTLPFPERNRRKYHYALPFADLEPDANTAYEMIITSRGCWGRCTFCTEPMMSKGHQRYRSPDNVIEEIEQLVKLHRGKRLRLHIADPNFGGNIRITEELCDKLIAFRQRCETKINIFISVRTSTMANHPNLVSKLCQAGVDFVFVGMESPKAEDLKAIRKGGGGAKKQELAVKLLQENGAAVMSCFLLGLPGQTEKDIFELLDYARSLHLEDAYFAVVCPLPGSQLYDEVSSRGELLEPDHRKWKLYDLVMPHEHIDPPKMRELCVRANSKWYDDLMLPQAYRRYVAKGREKRKLYDYATKFTALMGFFSFLGENQDELSDLDMYALVQEMPNPRLRAFTTEHPLQEMFDMDRFLKLLGDQTLQVTLEFTEGRVVSWVLRAAIGRVEYVECIDHRIDDATVSINVSMMQGSPSPTSAIKRILTDNATPAASLHLARLVAATAGEVSALVLDRLESKARFRVGQVHHHL